MFRNDKAQRVLGIAADVSLILCMFLEIVVAHTLLSQAGLLLFFFCTGLWMIVNRRLSFSFWMIASALVIAWSVVVSFGWAIDRTVSLSMVKTLIVSAAFFFFLYQYILLRGNLRRYLGAFVFSTLLILAYLFYLEHTFDWSVSRLGLLHGVNPNQMGILCAISFGACIMLTGKKVRLLWLLPIPVLLISVALTMSVKSAALAGFLLVAFLLVRFPKRWGWKLGGLIAAGVVVFYLAVLTDNPLSRGVLHRVREVTVFVLTGEGKGGSVLERGSLLTAAWSWFVKRPMIGWGLGCFRLLDGSLGMYAHNNYMELLVSGGIPMALLYYVGPVGALLYAARAMKRAKAADPEGKLSDQRKLVYAFFILLGIWFVFEFVVVSYYERQYAVFSILLYGAARLIDPKKQKVTEVKTEQAA